MPAEPRDDIARIIPNAAGEQQSVDVSRRLGIELVNAISEEGAEGLAFGIIAAPNDAGIHGA
jgi:hypothetical protein